MTLPLPYRLKMSQERVRAAKESLLCNPPGEARNMVPMIEAWRGDQMVLMVALGRIDPMVMAGSLRLIGIGCEAEALVLTTDTIMEGPNARKNPLTGQNWQPGELGKVFQHPDALVEGWISEALMGIAAHRNGDTAVMVQPYFDHGDRIEWRDADVIPDGSEAGGAAVNMITSALTPPPHIVKATAFLAAGVDQVTRDKLVLDTLKELEPETRGALCATPGTEREAALERLGLKNMRQ